MIPPLLQQPLPRQIIQKCLALALADRQLVAADRYDVVLDKMYLVQVDDIAAVDAQKGIRRQEGLQAVQGQQGDQFLRLGVDAHVLP